MPQHQKGFLASNNQGYVRLPKLPKNASPSKRMPLMPTSRLADMKKGTQRSPQRPGVYEDVSLFLQYCRNGNVDYKPPPAWTATASSGSSS